MSERPMSANGKLRFLKVLMPGFSTKLEVPPEFAKHIANKKNDGFNLWSPLQKPWHVKVLGEIPNLYFGDGWPQFVRYHDLEVGWFLIFCYEGPMQFTVQIFDRSSCEKDFSYLVGKDFVQSKGGERGNLQETFNLLTEKKNTGISARATTGLCNGEKLEELSTDDFKAISKGVCTAKVISPTTMVEKNKDSRTNEKDDEKHGTVHKEEAKKKKHDTIPEKEAKKTTSPKRTRRERNQNNINSFVESTTEGLYNGKELEGLSTDDSRAIGKGFCTVTEVISLKRMAGKRKYSKINGKEDHKQCNIPGEDAMKITNHKKTRREHDQNDRNIPKVSIKGLSKQEKNATFKVTLRPNNLRGHYYLYIPVSFKEAAGISQKNKLILKDPNRKLWWVDVRHSTKNRTLLVRGWKEFCVTNRLRPGDDCEFHITNDSVNGEKIFQVCITKNSKEYRKAAVKVQRTNGTIVSDVPWFWTKISFNLLNKYQLMQIPNAFTARLNISQMQVAILKDQKGRLFPTGLFHTTRNRTLFGRRWLNFARTNCLKPGDVCEFRPDPNFSINSTFCVNVIRKPCTMEGSTGGSSSEDNPTIHDYGL